MSADRHSAPAAGASEALVAHEAEAEIFKALGHPARLAIVYALAEGELCVCDLQRVVGLDTSTVSRHLLQLKVAGVLASRREANRVLYRLRLPCVLDFALCLKQATANNTEAAKVRFTSADQRGDRS